METEPQTLRPRPIADLTPENLKILVDDMGAEPGWYTSASLYGWYLGMCKEAGLEPVTQKKFGMVLRELGYRTQVRRTDGTTARCWYLTRRAARGEVAPRG